MRNPHEVAVLVHRSGRYLLLLRAPPHEVYWHVVAGAREGDETDEEGALRELEEETGLRPAAPLVDLGRPHSYPVDDELVRRWRFPPGTTLVHVRSFAAEAPDGWEPTLNSEHTEHRWCTLAEAVTLVRWPETRDALLHLGELRATRTE